MERGEATINRMTVVHCKTPALAKEYDQIMWRVSLTRLRLVVGRTRPSIKNLTAPPKRRMRYQMERVGSK